MKIDGITVGYLSDKDGLPVKNRLPIELKERMKTQNQWLEEGFCIKEGATRYEMHPNCLSYKTFDYILDKDVEKLTEDNMPKCCRTCAISDGRFCAVAGDYVSATHYCSEWTPTKYE